MRFIFLTVGILFCGSVLLSQDGRLSINGQILPFMIDECGDTIILAKLADVSISSPRRFENRADYLRYRKYRRYATKVYPYALDAIKLFREVEYVTQNMNKRQKRKYNKHIYKRLKEEFGEPLKKLTKTQGMILIEMIERELDTPLYELVKDLRGGLTASYWNTFSSFYGYKLKEGYKSGKDAILDAVLTDMNISYQLVGE